MRHRSRLLFLALALLVVLAGCKVDTTVTVDMRRDGSGVVSVRADLDAAAVQAVEAGGGRLEERVRLGDVVAAGWTLGAWERHDDGSASITLSKEFAQPDEVASILREINGTAGPLRDVQATRDRGTASTRYELTGTIDLPQLQSGIKDDPELLRNLTGQQIDVNALDASIVDQLEQAVGVKVVAKLPGRTTSFVGDRDGPVTIDASATVLDTRRVVLAVVAAILLVAALVVLVGGLRRQRRMRAR